MTTELVSINSLRANIHRLLLKKGHPNDHCDIITNVLMYAELRGNNQGIVKLVKNDLNPHLSPQSVRLLYETPVSAKFDGGNISGMVVLAESVSMAMRKSKSSGIGIVACSGYASATGALGYWARMIANEGLIGIVVSQCPEYVAPYGSFEPIFGTNPIAIGIPGRPRSLVLDMATSACAYYGLVTAREEGRPIPPDVAYDATGQPTKDPAAAILGALRTFDRGPKSSHLALMVELLAGALTGAAMEDKAAAGNWGSLVLALDPKLFGPDNAEDLAMRSAALCARVKNARPLPGSAEEVLLPGERGDRLEDQNLAAGSLSVSSKLYNELLRQLED